MSLLYGNKSFLCSSPAKKLCKEEKKDINLWAHLPNEILELIMKRLCLKDYLALRTICSSWSSTVTNAIANKHCCPLPELPLIVLRSKGQIFSLRTEREHCLKISIFESTKIICHGSVEGWMIMSDYVNNGSLLIFFFNPVTNRRVSVSSPLYLPSISPIPSNQLFMLKMVASSPPDHHKSGCYLAGLLNDCCHIAFYRVFDKSWNMIEIDRILGDHFSDLEIMGFKLYASTVKPDSILVYDLKDFGDGLPKPKVSVMYPQTSTPFASRIIDNQRHVSGGAIFYMAKHETLEQLFLISMIVTASYKLEDVGHLNRIKEFVTAPEMTAVEVFKLNMNKEPIEWIKCESLDDNAIFVSRCKSMVMSRASLNSTKESTIGENSVYFALQFKCPTDPWKGARLGIKHLTDSGINYFSAAASYPMWFVPSI
ncbi:uncharacterized protein LOC130723233 [Lotus japonicus]|uniref:uncharacterized protein LOC130723233 n=1 Tax=Lotus japonicus TaxID=34305 RepID=UPI00258779A6|nr:uncharacterized protein LOC130723233 [Lotus japonicus]